MNELPFSDWLKENINEERFSDRVYWDGGTVTLEEKDNRFHMCVRIENVNKHLVFVNFDNGVKQGLYFRRGDELSKRCDFAVLEETEEEFIAYLIELKGKVPDRDGAIQLKWSAPYFTYIFAVFLGDSLLTNPNKELKVKFFQIGKQYSIWANREFMKRQQNQRFQVCDRFSGPDFLYCTYQGHRLEFSDFRQA